MKKGMIAKVAKVAVGILRLIYGVILRRLNFRQVFPPIIRATRGRAATADGRLGIRDEKKRRSNRSTED